jgi:Pyridoxamine 5'-phosphate oxidase
MRTTEQRKADVLATLERNADLWIATASRSGGPHLVAVSAWWHSPDFVIATVGSSRTARNLDATDVARLALGAPDDVIVVDARLTHSVPVGDADEPLQAGFAAAVGWSPIEEPGAWRFFRLAPTRIQAYRGYGELVGRDVFSDGRWRA